MSKVNGTTAASETKHDLIKNKPYNRYNIYYILERQRFLQSNCNYIGKNNIPDAGSAIFITGYEHIDIPDLPSRYARLDLAHDWYMPGKRKATKRDHKKSHGLASFQEIARVVADGWKSIDDETLDYCTIVAELLKQRHKDMKAKKGVGYFMAMDQSPVQSNYDTRCDEIQQATSRKQPHRSCTPLPIMSDLIVNTTAAATACFPPNNAMGACNANGYDDAPKPEVIMSSRRSTSEVDIPDGDIMAMWYHHD